jgi:glycerophosphoryl diester phosphodiesterase
MPRPLVISHAACGGHAPENTLAGIRAALSFGVDAIEIDVQASADGVPVLMHDLTVDRSTNGEGEVARLSLEELRALDAGGEPVPTLAEVLELTMGKALLVMEIKQPGIEELLADVVRGSDALGDVMAWSFFPQALEGMRKAEPRIPAGLLVSAESLARWPLMRELALRNGLQAVSVFFAGVNEEIVSDCLRSGLALYTWTIDSEREMQRLIALGVDGICTNFPDRTIALLKEMSTNAPAPQR